MIISEKEAFSRLMEVTEAKGRKLTEADIREEAYLPGPGLYEYVFGSVEEACAAAYDRCRKLRVTEVIVEEVEEVTKSGNQTGKGIRKSEEQLLRELKQYQKECIERNGKFSSSDMTAKGGLRLADGTTVSSLQTYYKRFPEGWNWLMERLEKLELEGAEAAETDAERPEPAAVGAEAALEDGKLSENETAVKTYRIRGKAVVEGLEKPVKFKGIVTF